MDLMTASIAFDPRHPSSAASFLAVVQDRIRSLPGVEHVRIQPGQACLKVAIYLLPAVTDARDVRARIATELDALATLAPTA